MANVLLIESSPRKAASASTKIAQCFLAAHAREFPSDTIETLDVWSTHLPEFDGDTMQAKYAALHGVDRTPAQAAAWETLASLAAGVRDANVFVFCVPMWNFGILRSMQPASAGSRTHAKRSLFTPAESTTVPMRP